MLFNLSIYQIFIAILAIIVITQRIYKFIKRQPGQSLLKFLVTIGIWVGILTFTLFPTLSRIISIKLRMGENLNTLIFIGFIIIILLIFRLLSIIESLEKNITEIVRKEALKDIKNN